MKWMAVGEIGAFFVGLTSAIFVAASVNEVGTPAKILAFVVVWFLATKLSLKLVHLGYDPKANESG